MKCPYSGKLAENNCTKGTLYITENVHVLFSSQQKTLCDLKVWTENAYLNFKIQKPYT